MARLIRGAFAGLVATGLMSLLMAAARAVGILGKPPPKEITQRAAQSAGEEPAHSSPEGFQASWIAAHGAFGMGAGAVYVLLRFVLPGPAPMRGLTYGLIVWVTNYAGILPALGLYPSPSEDDPSRTRVMVAAHAVYGVSLGIVEQRLRRE